MTHAWQKRRLTWGIHLILRLQSVRLVMLWFRENDGPFSNKFVMMTSSNGNIFRVTGPLCGDSTVAGEFLARRPVARSFDVFVDLRLNKRLSKHPRRWWFVTPLLLLRRHCVMSTNLLEYTDPGPGGWINIKIKMSSYQYRKSHCGDKTILRPSYLHNGISYTGKTTSLYWIEAQFTIYGWWVGVTNSPFVNFSASKIFDLAKVPRRLFESHLYLTGATAAELPRHLLTHWGRDKMAAISQTTVLNAFSWTKAYQFRLRFHWSLIPRVQITIFQHWFR